MGLNGKPAPDIFLTAAQNLGVDINRSIVVEDAVSGVQAGKNGNFGLVLGLAREDNNEALKANGADIVVNDLEEITLQRNTIIGLLMELMTIIGRYPITIMIQPAKIQRSIAYCRERILWY